MFPAYTLCTNVYKNINTKLIDKAAEKLNNIAARRRLHFMSLLDSLRFDGVMLSEEIIFDLLVPLYERWLSLNYDSAK